MIKTKIVFFLPGLHGGGAERVSINMLRILDENKYDIHLVLTQIIGEYLDLIPAYIKVHDLKRKKTIFSILKLRKMIISLDPDIIFSTLFRTHIAIDLALLGMTKKPKIILRSPNSPKLVLENKQIGYVMRLLLERAYRNADMLIAQTPEMKNEIVKYHTIKEEKIIIYLNPIDTKLIDESIKDIENPFDTSYINIVAAGRLTKQKGFDILIRAWRDVIITNKKFRLYILGNDGGDEKMLKTLVTSLTLNESIYFLGFQKNPYKFFVNSDLYVLSSRWEGLPNTVLENLYLKKPVVSTRCIPFMDTLIDDGNNGLLVSIESPEELAAAIIDFKNIDVNHISKAPTEDINNIFKMKK